MTINRLIVSIFYFLLFFSTGINSHDIVFDNSVDNSTMKLQTPLPAAFQEQAIPLNGRLAGAAGHRAWALDRRTRPSPELRG